jgi:PAS domain S-box-containing protein
MARSTPATTIAAREIRPELMTKEQDRPTDQPATRGGSRRGELGMVALETILDSVPAVINAKDADSRYVFMNAYQARLYGTSPEAAIGRSAEDMLGAEYGAYTRALDARVLATGDPLLMYEERYAAADGVERDWLTTKLPLAGDDGRPRFVVTISIDVSERKRADERLRAALVNAEAANAVKSSFLATMSHELRTPLNAIIGFAEIMTSGIAGAEDAGRRQGYARDILSSARRLLGLIDNLLDLSRLESGREAPVDAPCRLTEVARVALLLHRADADAKGVVLTDPGDGDSTIVRADPRMLRQILINLIGNAVRYTQSGGTVRVSIARRATGDAAIAVADSGIGMSAAAMAAALGPFASSDPMLARPEGGSGLGLPIAQALAKRHDGRIEIESTPGRGTTAWVILPAERVMTAAPD